jgi:hypothetical protein
MESHEIIFNATFATSEESTAPLDTNRAQPELHDATAVGG